MTQFPNKWCLNGGQVPVDFVWGHFPCRQWRHRLSALLSCCCFYHEIIWNTFNWRRGSRRSMRGYSLTYSTIQERGPLTAKKQTKKETTTARTTALHTKTYTTVKNWNWSKAHVSWKWHGFLCQWWRDSPYLVLRVVIVDTIRVDITFHSQHLYPRRE